MAEAYEIVVRLKRSMAVVQFPISLTFSICCACFGKGVEHALLTRLVSAAGIVPSSVLRGAQ